MLNSPNIAEAYPYTDIPDEGSVETDQDIVSNLAKNSSSETPANTLESSEMSPRLELSPEAERAVNTLAEFNIENDVVIHHGDEDLTMRSNAIDIAGGRAYQFGIWKPQTDETGNTQEVPVAFFVGHSQNIVNNRFKTYLTIPEAMHVDEQNPDTTKNILLREKPTFPNPKGALTSEEASMLADHKGVKEVLFSFNDLKDLKYYCEYLGRDFPEKLESLIPPDLSSYEEASDYTALPLEYYAEVDESVGVSDGVLNGVAPDDAFGVSDEYWGTGLSQEFFASILATFDKAGIDFARADGDRTLRVADSADSEFSSFYSSVSVLGIQEVQMYIPTSEVRAHYEAIAKDPKNAKRVAAMDKSIDWELEEQPMYDTLVSTRLNNKGIQYLNNAFSA